MNARRDLVLMLSLAALLGMQLACATEPPKSAEAKRGLEDRAQQAIRDMEEKDPGLRSFLNQARGYAIFPEVGKGGLGVGGASGRGVVYDQGQMVGFAELNQATIGAQIGGQTFAELIVFQNEDALRRFQSSQGLKFSANVSAVAIKAGAAAAADYTDGVAVFTMPKGGAMLEASIGGQQFRYHSATESGGGSTSTTQPSP
jgi:lipid-binding SYLF domain-containing protein